MRLHRFVALKLPEEGARDPPGTCPFFNAKPNRVSAGLRKARHWSLILTFGLSFVLFCVWLRDSSADGYPKSGSRENPESQPGPDRAWCSRRGGFLRIFAPDAGLRWFEQFGAGATAPSPQQKFSLVRLSTDPYANATSQHATEVEPDTFAFGSTIVSAFQIGRRSSGGADIGFATSTDGGATWSSGFLPGLTLFQGSGTADADSDPSVAYDAAHASWIIATLPISGNSSNVAVSRSPDGINWNNPIRVSVAQDTDKSWIVCDNGASSPFFGHCYVEWDSIDNGLIYMSTSTDGGLTWGPEVNTENSTLGVGGQPVVQPNGTVIMPIASWDENRIPAWAAWRAITFQPPT